MHGPRFHLRSSSSIFHSECSRNGVAETTLVAVETCWTYFNHCTPHHLGLSTWVHQYRKCPCVPRSFVASTHLWEVLYWLVPGCSTLRGRPQPVRQDAIVWPVGQQQRRLRPRPSALNQGLGRWLAEIPWSYGRDTRCMQLTTQKHSMCTDRYV